MTGEKVKDVCDRYLLRLNEFGAEPKNREKGGTKLEHAAWMCLETKKFVDEGRLEKAFRWLGFIQGVLYCMGMYSIEEMKEHNRPPNVAAAT